MQKVQKLSFAFITQSMHKFHNFTLSRISFKRQYANLVLNVINCAFYIIQCPIFNNGLTIMVLCVSHLANKEGYV